MKVDILLLPSAFHRPTLSPSQTASHDVGGDRRKVELARGLLKSARRFSPSTPSLELDPSPAAEKTGERGSDANDRKPRDSLQSSEDGFWSAKIRRPKAGERVQASDNPATCIRATWCLFMLLVLVARWRRNAGPCGLPGRLVRNRGKQKCCFRVVKNTPISEAGQVGICTVRAFDSAWTRFRRGFHRPLPPFSRHTRPSTAHPRRDSGLARYMVCDRNFTPGDICGSGGTFRGHATPTVPR